MNKPAALLAGAGIGAAVAFFFDPEQGRRRRALVRDKTVHARKELEEAADVTKKDVSNRARGLRASLRTLVEDEEPSDDVLRERVRAAIGRVVSHPGAIEVTARDGVVTLSGPILADEVPLLIDRVLDVRGVRDVVNRLEVHKEPGNVPALQGEGKKRGGPKPDFLQENWAPATRLVGGAIGALASAYGFAGHGIVRKAVGVAGLALLARAATNKELRELTRLTTGRYGFSLQKTLHINAPVERVFELWANCENYPHFMTHVVEVRRIGGDGAPRRWHWKVRGRTGLEFEFNSIVTAYEENRFIAWRTEPGAWVQHAGSVRFHANPDGTTTVDIKMSYQPVAGAIGHVIAKLLGDDPKHQIDDDLLRMKTYLETGKPPHDAAAAQRSRL
jgi:uncharacterized membrane protein/gas vesicle protein